MDNELTQIIKSFQTHRFKYHFSFEALSNSIFISQTHFFGCGKYIGAVSKSQFTGSGVLIFSFIHVMAIILPFMALSSFYSLMAMLAIVAVIILDFFYFFLYPNYRYVISIITFIDCKNPISVFATTNFDPPKWHKHGNTKYNILDSSNVTELIESHKRCISGDEDRLCDITEERIKKLVHQDLLQEIKLRSFIESEKLEKILEKQDTNPELKKKILKSAMYDPLLFKFYDDPELGAFKYLK